MHAVSADKADSQKPIEGGATARIRDMAFSIGRLEQGVERLTEMLAPVLESEVKSIGEAASTEAWPSTGHCLGDEIQSVDRRLQVVGKAIDGLINRLRV